jgi:hypothetical protein
MFCGRCCVTEPRSRLALRLDILIEILLRTRVNKGMKRRAGVHQPRPLRRGSNAATLYLCSWPLMAPSGYGLLWTLT